MEEGMKEVAVVVWLKIRKNDISGQIGVGIVLVVVWLKIRKNDIRWRFKCKI